MGLSLRVFETPYLIHDSFCFQRVKGDSISLN